MTKNKIYTNEMVYDDAKSIGIDADSLKQLMNILTPRMQKQLLVSLKEEKFLNDYHNNEANDQPNWFKNGNLNKYYEVNQ